MSGIVDAQQVQENKGFVMSWEFLQPNKTFESIENPSIQD